MAINFPTSLDTLTNPTGAQTLDSPDHAGQHSDANDALEALEAKVGADSSVVTSSHDYKINQLETNNTGTNTGDETTTSVGSLVSGATAKTTPVDADNVAITDSAATHILKKVTWANIKATLKTYFDTLYAAALGADDNYVTDAEKIVIGNTSGTNTGDQTLPVKATGAEIDTGTDDAKFATPKAIADSALISNVVEDTTPQLGGDLDCNGNDLTDVQMLQMDATPDADHTVTGPTTNTIAAGYTSAVMDLVFCGSGGKWLEADASATSTALGLCGIALEAKTDTQAMLVALPGSFVRDDTWTWTVGGTIYMSETLGAMTQTAPSTTDSVVRVMGYAISATVMFFDPSPDHITVV